MFKQAETPPLSRLLGALHAEADQGPLLRRLIIAPTAGSGRELLRAMGRRRSHWSGFAVTTVRPLALQLAVSRADAKILAVLDQFEEEAAIHEALDAVLAGLPEDSPFLELGEGIGFRRAIRESVKTLRLAQIPPERMGSVSFSDPEKGRLLQGVLRHYLEQLQERGATDVAGALVQGREALAAGVPLPADRLLLLPGLSLRGVAGDFVRALLDRGALLLDADTPPGIAVPPGLLWPPRSPELEAAHARDSVPATRPSSAPAGMEDLPLFGAAVESPDPVTTALRPPANVGFFRAAGLSEELREVFRRVRATGTPFDEVEIVTPDPGVYGPALQTLASRMGIEVTYAVGLPVERTRPGRVLHAFVDWVTGEYSSAAIRRLLISGDLVAPGRTTEDSPRLGRELRALRIGWGRDRYLRLIDNAIRRRAEGDARPRRYETPEVAAGRIERELDDLRSLRSLMERLIEAVPGKAAEGRERISPARLARGVRTLMEMVEVHSEVDRSAHERMVRTLERIEATLTRPTSLGAAIAAVREHLSFRVPAPRTEGRAPWISDGGAIHLADIEHGGKSGRRMTFVVGLDQGRFPGSDRQDPILLDRERHSLGAGIPVTDDRMRELEFRLLALVEGVRGEVVVSYPAWEAAVGRQLQPSSAVLALFRRATGEAAAGYERLNEALGEPVSRVPRGQPGIDTDDTWLAAMVGPQSLRDARTQLRTRHAVLDRGLLAREAQAPGDAPGPAVGVVRPDASFDPTSADGPLLSASGLETLGKCPLQYFYGRVLRVMPPDDPEFDLEKWLSPGDRGTLLHDVFERAVRRARETETPFPSDGFRTLTLEVLEKRANEMHYDVPPPGESVFHAELAALREDALSWAGMMAESGLVPQDVMHVEFSLGGDGPLELPLPGGASIRVRGRIDRIDRTDDGLRVVDYKTGSTWSFKAETRTFNGGRRLQHLIYREAVDQLNSAAGDAARVQSSEYHFPTVGGENAALRYSAADLDGGMKLVQHLIEGVREGLFVPTNDPADCRYCDYREVCRFGSIKDSDNADTAPRVEWTRDKGSGLEPAVGHLLQARQFEDRR